MESKLLRAVVVGAGRQGVRNTRYAMKFPNRLKIVGVAEPRDFQREKLRTEHSIDKSKVFSSWEEMVALDKFADFVIIGTPDRLRKEPAVAFAARGYHVLLEKPMAVTPEDCIDIIRSARYNNVMLSVCHGFRYTPQVQKVRDIIDSGAIGDVVNIQLLEPVGFWHFAHSFVRGNWGNEAKSSFSLLSKSSHDLDMLLYWMGSKKCTRVSSFGSLVHFTKENAPSGASSRCLDCPVEGECAYSAKKIYLDRARSGDLGFPVNVITDVLDIENVTEALKTGPYGRCVYDCDNDVCDNQVVNMQFEGGTTASFTMVAYSMDHCRRRAKIFGTKGELTFDLRSSVIQHADFFTGNISGREATVSPNIEHNSLQGQNGTDFYALEAFVTAVATNDPSKILTGPEESLRSHMLTFAAEEGRKENRLIHFQEWLAQHQRRGSTQLLK